MNDEINAAVQAIKSNQGDVHRPDGVIVPTDIRLVELESLVGNLYLAKDIVSKPGAGEQAGYNTK